MANFFTDNDDITFLFDYMDLHRLAGIMEDDFKSAGEFDYAPENADDAVDNYRRVIEALGEVAGDIIAPSAEETDRVGNKLNDDGSVTYAPGIAEALRRLGQADMMGFTLPYKYGGINCPQLLYTMSNDIVSRSDASLMNIYGLQGIADTIYAFASDEIKDEYLPKMASGEKTAAMVLTEPDAGSDLQAVKVRAYQDANGDWFIHGVKRFITNGCGEILLVLARSEPEIQDGRGLSLFVVDQGPKVQVRRLENKLGIHGSPTCELFFDDAPAKLIGDRQRGLITYVMSMMNGARIGISAQSLGIGEAAYRVARDYGDKRKQFGVSIDQFPAVRELLVDMNVDIQAARALTYYSTFCVDLEYGALKTLHLGDADPAEVKQAKQDSRKFKRWNTLLTPMSKYYASEMSMRVANNSMAVLGGSGYMKDYAVERHLRDSRITTIYEGTSQLQVVAAVRGVVAGTINTVVDELLDRDWPDDVQPLVDQIRQGMTLLGEAVAFVKEQSGGDYMDLYARKLVDMACAMVIGSLFCGHATASEVKKTVARRWLEAKMPEVRMNHELTCSGKRTVITEFETLAGAVPTVE